MKIKIILVTGLPGTGKTTLGKKLAKDLSLPFIYKDGIKEILFDEIGWEEDTLNKKVGSASYELVYYFVETLLQANKSMILESNTSVELEKRLLEIKKRYDCEIIQVFCKAKGDILAKRYKERKGRHPGHRDGAAYENIREILLQGSSEPLDLGKHVIEVDTTNLNTDSTALIETLKHFLK